MTTVADHLDDESFLEQFENQTLDPSLFNRLGHLRLAWLYLHRYRLEKALALTCTGIKRYAEHHGAYDKFHLTISDALVRILDKRISRSRHSDWRRFLSENSDLLDDAIAVLNKHFSKPLLASDKAKHSLVAPDRKPLSP